MAQGVLLDGSKVLEAVLVGEYWQVSYGFHSFASFHKDDAASKRVIVTQLAGMGVGKTLLARTFDIHRASIYIWQEGYEQGGVEALVNLRKGPEPKVTEAIKDYIYALYKNLKGERKYREKIAEEVKKLYEVEVSREGIRRAVKEREAGEEEHGAGGNEGAESQGMEEEPWGESIEVKHGGALLALPMLQKYGVEETVVDGVSSKHGRY